MNVGMCLQMYNDLLELGSFAHGNERSDDLRNRRVTWPWVWTVKRISKAAFSGLQQGLGRATRETHQLREIAVQLFAVVGEPGRARIESRLGTALTLLGQHVELSQSLRNILGTLRRSGLRTNDPQ